MKLRNKKTGEILEHALLSSYGVSGDVAIEFMDENAENGYREYARYHSLAELNAEWEDAPEEPKEYWYIDCDGEVYSADRLNGFDLDRMLNISNCFNSREQAEKAVEKLKAWKRLKNKGFRFDKISGYWIEYSIKSFDNEEECEQVHKDLDLLFGGEE